MAMSEILEKIGWQLVRGKAKEEDYERFMDRVICHYKYPKAYQCKQDHSSRFQ